MKIKEITSDVLNADQFIDEKIKEISETVGENRAINALSGGVDSSVVTLLGHRALCNRLNTVFIQNGLMRKNEPEQVVSLFQKLGVQVQLIDAQKEFFKALKGVVDPEMKREAITQTFYKNVFGKIVRESGAKYLLQGTILTDVDETVAGIKRQHNVFEQLGINPKKLFGYHIVEPLVQIRKDGVRKVARSLGLPESTYNRIPFPGPALAARVIGEVTPEKIEIVRKATTIVEDQLSYTGAFQYMAILHQDRVTGMRDGKRDFGYQIEVRCWESIDARTAKPSKISFDILEKLSDTLVKTISEVVSITYNITSKPPSTMEAV